MREMMYMEGSVLQEKKRAGSLPWLILLIVCIGQFGPNYTQYQLSPLAPQLTQMLNLTPGQFSSVFSAPMIPAVFLSLVSGLLADKFGIKRVLSIGLAVTAAGTCWRIWSDSYSTLFVSMLLTGVGISFLNANSAKIIGSWFPPEKVGGLMGVVLAASTLGMTVGTGTTAMLPGVTSAYTIAAVISMTSLVLWVVFVRAPKVEAGGEVAQAKIADSLKVVVKSRSVWTVGFSLFFILGCNVIISSFLPTALGQRGVDAVAAGGYAAAVTVGNLVGCLLAPVVVSRLSRMKPAMMLLAVISAVGAAWGWQAPLGPALAACLFLTGVTMGGLMPLLMSIPIQLPEIGPAYAGTAGGFTGTLQLLGAVLIPTYVAAPIAGANMPLFFLTGGASMALVVLCALLLPELGRR